MRMLPLVSIDQLKTGMIVRRRNNDPGAYVVHSNYGGRVTAVRTVDITNPSEWKFADPAINTGMLIENPDNSVTLSCGKGKCCPVVKKINEDTYEVTDDDGNTIRVTRAQLSLIPDAVSVINGQELLCG